MSRVSSLHLRLEVVNGTMYLAPNMAATSMEGDAAAPDKLKLLLKARMGNSPLELQVVSIGRRSFLTNPLNRQWQDVSGSLVIPGLLHPATGIGATLARVSGPERLGTETVGGTEAYRLRGKIPAEALASLIGSPQYAQTEVAIDLWVDTRDFRLRQARLVGAILPDESPLLERTLALSDFDKAITIEAPIP